MEIFYKMFGTKNEACSIYCFYIRTYKTFRYIATHGEKTFPVHLNDVTVFQIY